MGECLYCAQSRSSILPKKFLSRITWYPVDLGVVAEKLHGKDIVKRICIQSILKPGFPQEIIGIIEYLRSNNIDLPISVSINPVHESIVEKLYSLGVDYLGVGLDTATPYLFRKYRKPYTWSVYWRFFVKTLGIMGYRKVYVHLIVGLGEKPEELYRVMARIVEEGGDIALFPYTGLASKGFNPIVDLEYYRSAQIVRYFLLQGYSLKEIIDNGRVRADLLEEIIEHIDKYSGIFYTSGCPYCNRPYYTENPRGPFYNIFDHNHYRVYRDKLIQELKSMVGRG